MARQQYRHRSDEALVSHFLSDNEHLWDDLPVPSVADPTDENLLKPKTLLECCKDAQEFLDEYDLNDGYDSQTLKIMRVHGHQTRMIGHFQSLLCHAESNDRHGHLWSLTNILRLVCSMANEADLGSVLSAAYSLKHATDMEKSFLTQDEAFDKAKHMGLTPEQAARQTTVTPRGRYALYDERKGEVVKSDTWKPPDFRSLIKAARTEAGKSEISCVLGDSTRVVIMTWQDP